MREMRAKSKIQKNNHQGVQRGPSFGGKTSSVPLLAHTHTHTHKESLSEKQQSYLCIDFRRMVYNPFCVKAFNTKNEKIKSSPRVLPGQQSQMEAMIISRNGPKQFSYNT